MTSPVLTPSTTSFIAAALSSAERPESNATIGETERLILMLAAGGFVLGCVWAFLLGYLIWGDIPGANTFIGAILILSAGFIIIISERMKRRAAAA